MSGSTSPLSDLCKIQITPNKMKKPIASLGLLFTIAALGSIQSASAFTDANANTLTSALNTAFYSTSGGGHYKDRKSGGDTGFWQQAETIEALIDAAYR